MGGAGKEEDTELCPGQDAIEMSVVYPREDFGGAGVCAWEFKGDIWVEVKIWKSSAGVCRHRVESYLG